MKIWFDFTNVPHAHFLSVILEHLSDKHQILLTSRKFCELQDLLHKKNINTKCIGEHYNNKFLKGAGFIKRTALLFSYCKRFDVSISCEAGESTYVSKIKRKKSLIFSDNDISPSWIYAGLVDYFICPAVFSSERIISQGMDRERIYFYNGYKEDVYIADYLPNPSFLDTIPFREYVVVRPANLSATYIKASHKKMFAQPLLSRLAENKENIIFLPRWRSERSYACGLKNVYIPSGAINGLDLCYYAKAVFTGAGTLAREAAALGVPAVSFYPGDKLLSVDKAIINEGRLFHSRDVEKIMSYFLNSEKKPPDRKRITVAQKQVFKILDKVLHDIERGQL